MIPREVPLLVVRTSSRLFFLGFVLLCLAGASLLALVPVMNRLMALNRIALEASRANRLPEIGFIIRLPMFLLILFLILVAAAVVIFGIRAALSGISGRCRLIAFPSGLLAADSRHGIPDFVEWREIRRIAIPDRGRNVLARQLQEFWRDDMVLEFDNGLTWNVSIQMIEQNRSQLASALSAGQAANTALVIDHI
jgi:hypothetical protein